MNEKILQLVRQATERQTPHASDMDDWKVIEKFAELIVRECIKECKQEWYDLNTESIADDDPFQDPRATGIRVGQKNGVLKCISKIKQHFGVEE